MLSSTPFFRFALQSWASDENNIFLSPDCVSYREAEAWATKLKKEIDQALAQAKKELK